MLEVLLSNPALLKIAVNKFKEGICSNGEAGVFISANSKGEFEKEVWQFSPKVVLITLLHDIGNNRIEEAENLIKETLQKIK
jgi:hypothetical protein